MSGLWSLLFAAGFAVPVLALLRASPALLDSTLFPIARFSALQAGSSALLACAIGLPLGFLLRSRPGADRFFLLPFALPGAVAAVGWVMLLSPAGWLPWAYSGRAVVLAHAWTGAPWIAVCVAMALREIDPKLVECARTLGAGRFLRFRAIGFPAASRALLASTLQVFSFAVMSFSIVLLLGGGPPVETLETAIYAKLRSGELDLGGAAAAAVLQILLSGVPWVLALRIEARAPRIEGSGVHAPAGAGFRGHRLLLVSVLALLLLPFGASVFSGDASIARGARALLGEGEFFRAAGTSVALAFSAAACAVAFALLSLSARAAPALMGAASGVSALALGVGAWMAYADVLFDPLRGSVVAMALLQALLFSPLAYRALWAVSRGSPRRLHEAARTLGASRWRRWVAIEWPRLRPAVLRAFALAFAASIGELGAAMLFAGEGVLTLPVLLARNLALYRFDEARVLSLFLLTLAAAPFLGLHLIYRKKDAWTRSR